MRKVQFFIISLLILQTGMAQSTVTDHRSNSDTSAARSSFEEMTLYRIKLLITTGTAENANTDSKVYVLMNYKDDAMHEDGFFYLAKSINDFEKGKKAMYDFTSENIKKVKDVQFVKFGLTGDDAVCIKKLEIYFNNSQSAVYEKTFPGEGQWMDSHNSTIPRTFKIEKEELRASKGWRLNDDNKRMASPPSKITKAWMLSLVECAIGNQITHGDDLLWGSGGFNSTISGKAVDIQWKNDHTLHVDLDLQEDVRFAPNPAIDVDFDLDFRCENGVVVTDTRHLKFNTNMVGKVELALAKKVGKYVGEAIGNIVGGVISGPGGAAVAGYAGSYVGGKLTEALSFDVKFDIDNPNTSQSCKLIKVTRDCDVLLK